MSYPESLKRIYRKIAALNPHLNFMNYYEELTKNGKFSSLTNDLAIFAGYLAGNDVKDFRDDIIEVCLKHQRKNSKK
jgi:hypothetical protein